MHENDRPALALLQPACPNAFYLDGIGLHLSSSQTSSPLTRSIASLPPAFLTGILCGAVSFPGPPGLIHRGPLQAGVQSRGGRSPDPAAGRASDRRTLNAAPELLADIMQKAASPGSGHPAGGYLTSSYSSSARPMEIA